MFSSPAFAQDGANLAQQPGLLEGFLPIVLIMVVFWFLILRPQNKKMKEHRAMVANAAKGDTVVTAGGIKGKITRVREDDNEVEIEIAEGVKVRVVRSTLSDVISRNEPAKPAEKADKKDKKDAK